MDEYPGNPTTNKLTAGVTDEDILKAIKSSGYVLQSVAVDRIINSAANVLRSSEIIDSKSVGYRFRCQEEWSYLDRDSGDTRALDALISVDITDERSRKPLAESPAETLYFYVDMLMECKQSDLPYLFFMRPANTGDVPHFSGLPYEWLSIQNAGSAFAVRMRTYDVLGTYDLPIAKVPPTAISMSKARRQGKSLELSGEEAFKGLALPLSKALQYYYKLTQPSKQNLYTHVHLVLVVAVLRAPMIGVSMADGEITTTALPWVRLVRVDPAAESWHSEFSEPMAIDVVHADYLAEYTKFAMESCLDISRRMMKFANPLLSGTAVRLEDEDESGTSEPSGDAATTNVANETPFYESMRSVISDEEFMAGWTEWFARQHSPATEDGAEVTVKIVKD